MHGITYLSIYLYIYIYIYVLKYKYQHTCICINMLIIIDCHLHRRMSHLFYNHLLMSQSLYQMSPISAVSFFNNLYHKQN